MRWNPAGSAGSDFRGGRAADSLACKPYEVYRAEKLGRDSGENPEAV